jgi:hypothetical protein
MGLAQILLEQERRAEARDLLAPLCARLEGVVDGAVLRVIRRLLDAS